ncbi:MAG: T9SS type A sorting domain-containing protein [Bacteroidota bacterium]
MIKKKYILFLFVISSMRLLAQNWSAFNPSYRYNYSLENEGYTTAVVFADSTLTSGSDQVFSLNRIVLKCDVQNSFMQAEGCTDTSYWLANQPQFLQRRIVYSGQDYRLSDTSNYIIKHLEPIGSPWVFNATYSITAQVQSKIQKNIFGTVDSVKIILLSTADTILLSKQFGIIKYPAKFGLSSYYKLRGIENKASYDVNALYGEKVPNYYDFFKLKPGVKLYYSMQNMYNDGCEGSLYGIYTVLNSSLTGTVVANTMREQFIGCKSFSACNTYPNPHCQNFFGGPNPGTPYYNLSALQTSTIQSNSTDPYATSNTAYNTGYNNELKSLGFGVYFVMKFGMTDNLHFYKSYGASCLSKHIRSNPLNEGTYEGIRLMPTNTTNLYLSDVPISYNAAGGTYITDYGMVSNYNLVFESMYLYCTSLIIDGNDSLGGTSALTMSINDAIKQDQLTRVYPNPARYDLTVLVPYEAQTHGYLILTDALGNSLKAIKINGEESLKLNIENLSSGIYFLKIESDKYRRTFKIVKD